MEHFNPFAARRSGWHYAALRTTNNDGDVCYKITEVHEFEHEMKSYTGSDVVLEAESPGALADLLNGVAKEVNTNPVRGLPIGINFEGSESIEVKQDALDLMPKPVDLGAYDDI